MKKIISLFLMSFVGMIGTYGLAGSTREETVTRLQNSVDVLHAIISTPDKGIPEEVLSNAKCFLVVPDLIKGGFIFGGNDSTRAIYGKDEAFGAILAGKTSTPKSAEALVHAVAETGQQARIAEAGDGER